VPLIVEDLVKEQPKELSFVQKLVRVDKFISIAFEDRYRTDETFDSIYIQQTLAYIDILYRYMFPGLEIELEQLSYGNNSIAEAIAYYHLVVIRDSLDNKKVNDKLMEFIKLRERLRDVILEFSERNNNETN
jgi:hypothetical protein